MLRFLLLSCLVVRYTIPPMVRPLYGDESYILINLSCLILSHSTFPYLIEESSPLMCRNPCRSLCRSALRLHSPRFLHLRRITAAFARRPPALLDDRQILVGKFSRCSRRSVLTSQRRIQSERFRVCSTFVYCFSSCHCCGFGFSFSFGLRGRRFRCQAGSLGVAFAASLLRDCARLVAHELEA
jgi:hypothetical protein